MAVLTKKTQCLQSKPPSIIEAPFKQQTRHSKSLESYDRNTRGYVSSWFSMVFKFQPITYPPQDT